MLPNIAASYIPNKVHANASDAQLIIDIMSKLEAAISLAHYENTLAYYCQPQFVSEKAVLGTDLYHPLVDGAVANDANFSKNMIISGDNASGKSTYLRTVAISLITSQTLNIAFASNLSVSYGNVMSSMGVSDSIETGDSYFISESKSIKRMLKALGKMIFHTSLSMSFSKELTPLSELARELEFLTGLRIKIAYIWFPVMMLN